MVCIKLGGPLFWRKLTIKTNIYRDMFSTSSASRKFARIRQQQEILLWRYAVDQSPRAQIEIGAKLLAVRLKQSLLGAFYGAVLDIKDDQEDSWEAADRRALRNEIIHARALGPAAVVKRVFQMKDSMTKWQQAREKNDFSVVAPSLQKLVDSVRQEARYKAAQMGLESPYEALLRGKTPGFSMEDFEGWIAELEKFSRQSLNIQSKGRDKSADRIFAMREHGQHWLQNSVLSRMGYDFDRGGIKTALHPLCLGTHDNVPIGMRYNEDDFAELLLTVAHEGGHALYRQNVPAAHKDKLVGGIAGVGMDEAMALLMENHVMRSRPTVNFMSDFIRVTMPDYDYPDLTGAELFKRMTRISDEPVRTEADEVRYPLDVILRYKIEKALIDGDMQVADIPKVWAEEYERLTGMEVKDDNEGPLQDIHWFGGEFGWFPNYLLGQLAAAQLFESALKESREIGMQFRKGDMSGMMRWLNENIYKHGARYTMFELVENATGRPLDTKAYMRHIVNRYLKPLVALQARRQPLLPPDPHQ